MSTESAIRLLPDRTPGVGELVQVRSRRWLVEEVVPAPAANQSAVVRLSCADDDAQGQALDVYWNYEADRRILKEEAWQDLATKGDAAYQALSSGLEVGRIGHLARLLLDPTNQTNAL